MSVLKSLFMTFFIIAITSLVATSCTHLDRVPASAERTPDRPTVLIGNIPGVYLNQNKNKFFLGYIEIENRIIKNIGKLTTAQVKKFVADNKSMKNVIQLKSLNSKNYDAIYPGLINLHNHTKQNVLPTWPAAKGQFQNRFEWRAWTNYKKSVSKNMNPWIGYGAAMNCAAFRWSNLQNMINGTVFLQGPSSCIDGFGIYKVEDARAYVSEKDAVQAPTDLVYPNEMVYVWDVLKPEIEAGSSYEQALLNDIKKHCSGPEIDQVTLENINKTEGVKILSNKKILEASCTKEVETLHPKFIRYVYFIHKTIAGKKEYIQSENRSAIIAHLAEGRRKDPYNQVEYQLIKLIGLNKPYVNFIHGVGLRGDGIVANDATDVDDDYLDMAKNKMGLIWSPYSNLLLYGETLDIEAAHRAGINLAIGSDWVPTGTKSVLEEIKLAARYVDRNFLKDRQQKLNKIFTDEYLYKMMTENSAKMINHWEITPNEAGVGRIAKGAMGSVIVTSILNSNPYTNIVRKVTEKEINLVVVDGNPLYGNTDYLDQAGQTNYEVFSNEIYMQSASDTEKMVADSTIPRPDLAKLKNQLKEDDEEESTEQSDTESAQEIAPQEESFLNQLANATRGLQIERKDNCQFSIPKAFVTPNTKIREKKINSFLNDTDLDLDKVSDIQLLLAVSSMTQSLNRLSPQGDPKFAMPYFPNLYTCNDSTDKHSHRYHKYITSDGNDELKENLLQRDQLRKGVPSKAESLAKQYKLKFEVK